MNILFHYPSELYVLSYLPSFLLLSVITSVNIDAFRDFTFGEWIWVFPLVLVLYFILILFIIPKFEHFKRKSSNNDFTKLRLAKDNGVAIDAVGFFPADELKQAYIDNKRISCTYYPEINEFRGNRKLQICITGYKIN